MSNEAKWYVLHTYSGYEKMVKDSLKQLIENNNLQNQIVDIQIPMEQCIEESNGKKKVIARKLFPCYVFIKLVYSNDLWFMITTTRGVTGFVGPQGKPQPLSAEEVQKMQLETYAQDAFFNVGDTINVVAGPLAGNAGTVEAVDVEHQKTKVKLSMFGRETVVELDFVQIQKV